MISANALFKTCAKIHVKMFCVFKYITHIHTPNTIAEIIFPQLCNAPNSIEVIAIAKVIGTINLSLFRNTPLNNNSSQTGETITVDNMLPTVPSELMAINGMVEEYMKLFIHGNEFSVKIDKYNIPYEKNTFTKTINRRDFGDIFEKTFLKSLLNSSLKKRRR